MKESSFIMRKLRSVGLDSLAWPLRRLHVPVAESALVLEVGSGGSPFPRSNVLVDPYQDTRERHWVPLVIDRPFVYGFGEKLPFRDKAFDFVIACHVLEHSRDPASFLGELERVAHAGYIEVPDAFFERVNPYRDHRLEITVRGDSLVIRKKQSWKVDPEVVELYEHRAKKVFTGLTYKRFPFDFHVRYFWSNHIKFQILNPETALDWGSDEVAMPRTTNPDSGFKLAARVKKVSLDMMRKLMSQHTRNKKIDLHSLLACPYCRASGLEHKQDVMICAACDKTYQIQSGVPVLI